MAIVLNGMSEAETVSLTRAMMHSGRVMELPEIEATKESTSIRRVGWVIKSLVLGPLAALVRCACR